jgi:curli production assembly/transport component CsgF
MKKILLLVILPVTLFGSELKFQFKSPIFNGVGYSNHILNIENISFTRKSNIAEEAEALALQLSLAEAREPVNVFMTNLQSRIYSELTKQITEQLFAEDGDSTGSFTLEDSTINWSQDSDNITLDVYDSLTGSTTTILIPIGSLYLPAP